MVWASRPGPSTLESNFPRFLSSYAFVSWRSFDSTFSFSCAAIFVGFLKASARFYPVSCFACTSWIFKCFLVKASSSRFQILYIWDWLMARYLVLFFSMFSSILPFAASISLRNLNSSTCSFYSLRFSSYFLLSYFCIRASCSPWSWTSKFLSFSFSFFHFSNSSFTPCRSCADIYLTERVWLSET